MTPNLLPTPEAAPGSEPLLTVQLPLSAWQRVLPQLAEGSINQFLGLLTAIQQQLQSQLQPSGSEG